MAFGPEVKTEAKFSPVSFPAFSREEHQVAQRVDRTTLMTKINTGEITPTELEQLKRSSDPAALAAIAEMEAKKDSA